MKNTFKLLQYPNYLTYNVHHKSHWIHKIRKVNINNPNNIKLIIVPSNSMIIMEKNLSKLDIKIFIFFQKHQEI